MKLTNKINRIKSKLENLKRLDQGFNIFGAVKHQYQSTKVHKLELTSFEHQIGVELPKEFRTFLLEIGTGAGPNYGLYSLRAMASEFEDWNPE